MKTKKTIKCRGCGKGGRLKNYIIADDLENPRPYHKKCMEQMMLEVMIQLYIPKGKKR